MSVRVYEITGEEGKVSRDRVFEYVRRFKVDAGTPTARPNQILALADLPLPFERHPGDPRALADQPEIRQDEDNPQLWEVTIPYSSKIDDPEESENPLQRPAKIAFRREKFTRITVVDGRERLILNSAGDLVEVERDDNRLVISVQKNVPTVPRWIDAYSDAVNRDRIRIRGRVFKKGTLKFEGLSIPNRETTENSISYVPLAFELHHRQGGWAELMPNRGFNERIIRDLKSDDGTAVGKSKRLEKILVGDPPEPATEPVWLDKEGKAFRDSSGKVRMPDRREMILLHVKIYPELPFRLLPIN